ncbi:conserved membrane protein of unknown function [Tenacibaculum sp. 190130A14a]|uniref:Uncharacterized protein n=1 Tax=Tenacibaculum polynesiense TaxID=3137857 RepID=A0ABM9PC30_9FLAO
MSITKQFTVNTSIKEKSSFNIINLINKRIDQEKENAIGLAVVFIMVGTMIASISAALAIHGKINLFALVFSCITAMGANATAISQQPFKTIVWAFIINIIGNILLIIYQLM